LSVASIMASPQSELPTPNLATPNKSGFALINLAPSRGGCQMFETKDSEVRKIWKKSHSFFINYIFIKKILSGSIFYSDFISEVITRERLDQSRWGQRME
jgi:hypothetical protein